MENSWETVKPVLRDHCHERPPVLIVLDDRMFMVEGSTFHCSSTCHQRTPVLRDQWAVVQDRSTVYSPALCTIFYCFTITSYRLRTTFFFQKKQDDLTSFIYLVLVPKYLSKPGKCCPLYSVHPPCLQNSSCCLPAGQTSTQP